MLRTCNLPFLAEPLQRAGLVWHKRSIPAFNVPGILFALEVRFSYASSEATLHLESEPLRPLDSNQGRNLDLTRDYSLK